MTSGQNFPKNGLETPRDGLEQLGEDSVTDLPRPKSLAYRFDDLMLVVGQRRLRRGGQDVPLSKLSFAVLRALVESAPNLLTHDEMVRRVWGPRRIVTPENLSQRVKLLRDALGDDAAQPRYIESVRGEGYRLMPAVVVVSDAAESSANDVLAAPATPERGTALPSASPQCGPHRLAGAHGASALAAVAVLFAVAIGFFSGRPSGENPPVAGAQRLVTDFPGNHTAPTFSPDGAMIAFASDASGEWQIWVQSLAGSGPAVQLTDERIAAREPSWSPLNDQIAFVRGASIWSIDPLGATQPRRIIDKGFSPNFSWDGRLIVYWSSLAIWLANADGTDPRPVAGTEGAWGDPQPHLSPDGQHIAYFRNVRGQPLGDIWIVPSAGGQPRRLTFEEDARVGSPAWTPDGRFIIYQSSRGGTLNLWSVPFEGGDPRPVTVGAGEHGAPFVSRDGRSLLYTNRRAEWELVRSDPATGTHDVVLRSRNSIILPQVSPDGSLIAYFSEVANGVHVFTVGSDGSGLRQLTFGDEHFNLRPTWSGDGRSLLFYQDRPTGSLRRQLLDGGPSIEVFANFRDATHSAARERPQGDTVLFVRVAEPDSGRPNTYGARSLMWDISTGAETVLEPEIGGAVWSRDGDEILGTRDGYIVICPLTGEACDVPEDGGEPIRGSFPQWSSDGSRIYFVRLPDSVTPKTHVWVVDRDGRNARRVLELAPRRHEDVRFDVTPDDRIVWGRYLRGDEEIWIATLGD